MVSLVHGMRSGPELRMMRTMTLVVTDRPLTIAEWAKYDRQSKNLEQLYSTGTKGLAQLTTGGLEKSRLPG